jgi:hypothetical protein
VARRFRRGPPNDTEVIKAGPLRRANCPQTNTIAAKLRSERGFEKRKGTIMKIEFFRIVPAKCGPGYYAVVEKKYGPRKAFGLFMTELEAQTWISTYGRQIA